MDVSCAFTRLSVDNPFPFLLFPSFFSYSFSLSESADGEVLYAVHCGSRIIGVSGGIFFP